VTQAGTRTSSFQDAASYDGVSEAFDRFSERFSTPLARRLLDAAQVGPSDRVLDVGTGTGVVALLAAARVAPEARVLGIDISEEMLATARAKAARVPQADRVELRRVDVQALDLPDASFDVVVSLFAVQHLPDPAGALTQMHRVLRPGGRLAVAMGSGPPLLSTAAVVRAIQRVGEMWRLRRGRELSAPAFLERLARRRWPASDTYHATHHPRAVDLPGLVRAAGFMDVRTFWEGHATVLDSPDEFWELQRTYATLVRERLARASADEVQHLRDEVLKAARRVQSRGGRLTYRHAALFVTARRALPSHG
jgi:ubiquinone/menaquinone biosynthesis C-methylase UbiE